ncbi:MAG: CBS domain-containing protein [Deltaproteobacteria bacterium]|nr:CBS domain-containing protein [Deltaproteobacteria bacterium]
MLQKKKIREVMILLEDYPHIPYWFTLRQAVATVQESALRHAGVSELRTMLVFNEKYQLVGILTPKDLLKGLDMDFLRESKLVQTDPTLDIVMVDLFGPRMKKHAERPVSEVMSPVKVSVKADDSMAKALFLMVQENLDMMPVMEEQRMVGVVRFTELFLEISPAILEKTTPAVD